MIIGGNRKRLVEILLGTIRSPKRSPKRSLYSDSYHGHDHYNYNRKKLHDGFFSHFSSPGSSMSREMKLQKLFQEDQVVPSSISNSERKFIYYFSDHNKDYTPMKNCLIKSLKDPYLIKNFYEMMDIYIHRCLIENELDKARQLLNEPQIQSSRILIVSGHLRHRYFQLLYNNSEFEEIMNFSFDELETYYSQDLCFYMTSAYHLGSQEAFAKASIFYEQQCVRQRLQNSKYYHWKSIYALLALRRLRYEKALLILKNSQYQSLVEKNLTLYILIETNLLQDALNHIRTAFMLNAKIKNHINKAFFNALRDKVQKCSSKVLNDELILIEKSLKLGSFEHNDMDLEKMVLSQCLNQKHCV